MNRIHAPSIDVKVRLDPVVLHEVTLWREDHFTQTTRSPLGGEIVQRYLVLDFGAEERAVTLTDLIEDPIYGERPVPRLDDHGDAVIEWRATGAIHIELQRVGEDGEGLSTPTIKIIPAPSDHEVDVGWVGWQHQADSPRRPHPYTVPDAAQSFVKLSGGTMDLAGNVEVVEMLAADLIACYRESGEHVGLSINYTDRRCYVCDELWPCGKATDFDATHDVDSESESVHGEAASGG